MYINRLLVEKWMLRHFNRPFSWWPRQGIDDEIGVLEELSYYLVPRETWATRRGSGEAWVRREMTYSFLLLVQHKLGREAAKTLRAAYKKHGVKYRPRRQTTAAERERLRAQLRGSAFGPNNMKNWPAALSKAMQAVAAERVTINKAIENTDRALTKLASLPLPTPTPPRRRRITFEDD
jgi:hypothetical protein